MKTALTILAAALLASGCSTIVGPAPTEDNIYQPTVATLKEAAGKDWTNFPSLAQADERLLGMIHQLQRSARDKESLRQVSGDIAGASTVGGALAAATGHLRAAKVGAGIAGLVSIGDQRYQLTIQRTNMLNAAKAYQCLRESILNLDEQDLKREFYLADPDPSEKQLAEIDQLNATRIEALQMVSSSASAIKLALEDAQAKIEIRQPNVDQIRESMEGRAADEGNLPKQSLRAGFAGPQGFVGAFDAGILGELGASEVNTSNMFTLRTELQKMLKAHADEQATLTRLRDQAKAQGDGKKALAAAFDSQLLELDNRQRAVASTLASLKQFIQQAAEESSISDARLRYVRARITALPNRLTVCRAIIGAG